ncbi:hypothetical protein F2Q68_00003898 [Brassica cretica]|uniref:Uncharacterized protein n=1 Tax=Brassica cretica TaxID=69181 RepID=A0A8S9JCW3_BRACR|nr:hypothetical protein F2Q68_00003898 [Brassica cretica]
MFGTTLNALLLLRTKHHLTSVQNEEEQAVERIEGNGGVRAPSLVLPGTGDSKLFSGLSIFGKLAIVYYSFFTVICALIFHVWYDTERLAPATNEEEQAVERVEGNGGVRAPSLVVGGLKDGDEASLERIHHLGPTENGQIDFKEM